jgi:hypothetical protein
MFLSIKEGRIDEAQSALNTIIEKWEDISKKASGDIDMSIIQ